MRQNADSWKLRKKSNCFWPYGRYVCVLWRRWLKNIQHIPFWESRTMRRLNISLIKIKFILFIDTIMLWIKNEKLIYLLAWWLLLWWAALLLLPSSWYSQVDSKEPTTRLWVLVEEQRLLREKKQSHFTSIESIDKELDSLNKEIADMQYTWLYYMNKSYLQGFE